MKEYLNSRHFLIESFLKNKNLIFEECTIRQKEILTKENPDMWDFYQWNL
jgi:hypothetical protein